MADAVSSDIRRTKELGGGSGRGDGDGVGVRKRVVYADDAFLLTRGADDQTASLDIVLLHGSRGFEWTASDGRRRELMSARASR